MGVKQSGDALFAKDASAPNGFASFRYTERGFKIQAVKVLPGEFYVDTDDTPIVTVLGSCVAVCLRDPAAQVGGMNHFLLPDGGDSGLASTAGRYGVNAMEMLINELVKRGAQRHRLEAKVFGGGHVMRNFTSLNVGQRNAEFTKEFLKTEAIRLLSEDLLDIYPRKVCFLPKSGRALVKKLAAADETLVMQEKQYQSQLVEKPVAGDIELF
ncbi:MAG: chemoreceptor glutamine deamidase CheD [Burkholderiales bacterium]